MRAQPPALRLNIKNREKALQCAALNERREQLQVRPSQATNSRSVVSHSVVRKLLGAKAVADARFGVEEARARRIGLDFVG